MRMQMRLILAIVFLSIGAMQCVAVQPDEMLSDAALESRARILSRELRCMVCQNQSIDDSEAPLARDLRLLVRERLKAGDSDSQVIDYLVARYGEFVLLKPRVTPHSIWLWLIPFAVLAGGAIGSIRYLRAKAAGADAVPPLSSEEQRQVAALTDPDRR
jgi:cytochrome c-type biogenesis protein CcmH